MDALSSLRPGECKNLLWVTLLKLSGSLLFIDGVFYLLLFNLAFIQSAEAGGGPRDTCRGVVLISFAPFVTGLIECEVSGCVLGTRSSVYTFSSGAFHRAQSVIESHRILRRP